MADSIGDESLKLTATWFNAISVATMAAGVVVPVVNQLYGERPINLTVLTLVICGCTIASLIPHLAGLLVRGGLDVSDE
jgi:ABC-type enterobactin transport system permease subunit